MTDYLSWCHRMQLIMLGSFLPYQTVIYQPCPGIFSGISQQRPELPRNPKLCLQSVRFLARYSKAWRGRGTEDWTWQNRSIIHRLPAVYESHPIVSLTFKMTVRNHCVLRSSTFGYVTIVETMERIKFGLVFSDQRPRSKFTN